MNSSSIVKKALEYIEKNQLISKNDRIVAGVSGGADSMCMLMLLLELREKQDIELIVAHVDHGIRGEEAKRDAEFVRDFCAGNSVKFELARADIPRIAQETGTTCEEAGRNFRYDFFCRLAERYNAEKIAVAHNSGDNAETVLFNMFRGSGLGGLKGILPLRPIKSSSGREFTIIRPVLCLSRAEIETVLKEKGQDYCIDSTNGEDSYARNRIRNTFLPMAVQSINSNADLHISSLSRQVQEVVDYIAQESEKSIGLLHIRRDSEDKPESVRLDGPAIMKLHPVIRKHLIRKAFEIIASRLKDVEEGHILSIEELFSKQSGRKISLPYGITAIKEYDDVRLMREEAAEQKEEIPASYQIYDRNELPDEIPKNPDEKWYDYDKIGEAPVFRLPKEGDYLLIGKEKHKKSLSRFLIDNKIPLKERSSIHLMTAGNHVLWVIGIRQDESSLVTSETKRVLVAKKNGSEKVTE